MAKRSAVGAIGTCIVGTQNDRRPLSYLHPQALSYWPMNYADLTYEEIRDLVPETAAVFIPLGCTEQQGPTCRSISTAG